jgi:hypothetical protein
VRRSALLLATLLAAAAAAPGQEPPPADDLFTPPDPFASEAPLETPPAGAAAASGGPSWFDPDAVRAGKAPEGVRLGPVELHGRANVTFSYTDGLEPIELLDHAELELSSLDLYAEWFPTAWLGFLAEGEFTRELEEDEHALEVEPELAVVELRPLSTDRLRLRAGLFPVPFGLERRFYAPPRNELVTRPAAFRQVFPGTWSDLGVMAWGKQPLPFWGGELELEVGLVRGLEGPGRRGDRQALEHDENHEPMIAGRGGWTVFDVDEEEGAPLRVALTIGASLVAGHWDDDRKRRLRYEGFDAALHVGPLSGRVEVIFSKVELEPPETSRRMRGLYVVAAWRHDFEDVQLLKQLHLAGRWDLIDDDSRVRDAHDVERFHVAVGWVPVERLLVKLEAGRARYLDERVWTTLVEVGYSF